MFSWLSSIVGGCLGPVRKKYARMSRDRGGGDDGGDDVLLWSRDIGPHAAGEYSFAVVQANEVLEDHSQVETGVAATFVGVYDGHGGADAALFISDHLFLHLLRLAQESGRISEDVVRNAYLATEDGFLEFVRTVRHLKPLIAAIGSCCLVGLIWRGMLYVANVGDSRAVVGCLGRSNKIIAEQLTSDHNASEEAVRQELRSLHPDDSQIVVLKNGVWRIKGIIQVSRSIGDAYLKMPEFSLDPSVQRFRLPEPLRRPVLTAEPSLYRRMLSPNDKFLIFASDGLWEHVTNQEAAEIVHNHPRAGIARRLVERALEEAARKRRMEYAELKKMGKGMRRFFHDDITVIVIFIDHELLQASNPSVPELSIRGFSDAAGPSNFSAQDLFRRNPIR